MKLIKMISKTLAGWLELKVLAVKYAANGVNVNFMCCYHPDLLGVLSLTGRTFLSQT